MGLRRRVLDQEDGDINSFDEEEDTPSIESFDDTPSMTQDDPIESVDDDAVTTDEEDQDDSDTAPVPTSRLGNRFADIMNAASARPEGAANSRYRKFLDEGMPEEKPPSKLNRLGAILGGMSDGYFRGAGAGIKTKEAILNSGYDKSVQRFSDKAKVLNAAAQQEDKVEQNNNRFARTAVASIKDEESAANTAAKIKAQTEHWNAQDKATAANAKTKGFTHVIGTDGNLYFEKPNADGTVTKINGGKVGESIPEKSKRLLDAFKDQEKVRQNNRLDLEGTRHKNRLGEEDNSAVNTRINQNINRGGQMAADAANKDAIAKREDARPAAQHAARLNRLDEALTNPDNLAQAKKMGVDLNNFVAYKKDAQGNKTVVGIKNPTSGDHQINKKVYDILWNHMFGEDKEE